MPEPMDYACHLPASAKRRTIPLLAAVICMSLSAWITYVAVDKAATIQYAGLYRASVSFEGRLSLKAYHVQWPEVIWLLPLGGIASGVFAAHDGWRAGGRRCWMTSAICAAAWLAMDILWR